MKKCPRCKVEKEEREFDGKICKGCQAEIQKARQVRRKGPNPSRRLAERGKRIEGNEVDFILDSDDVLEEAAKCLLLRERLSVNPIDSFLKSAMPGIRSRSYQRIDPLLQGVQYNRPWYDRRLDSMARILGFLLRTPCVAVCYDATNNKLYIATNEYRPRPEEVKATLKLAPIVEKRLSIGKDNASRLKKLASRRVRGILNRNEYKELEFLGIARDCRKIKPFLVPMRGYRGRRFPALIDDVTIVTISVDRQKDVHAELRIVDHLHRIHHNPSVSPLYLGVSLNCCPKCHTVLTCYNQWELRRFSFGWRGFHSAYEGTWNFPNALVHLRVRMGQFGKLLTLATSPDRDEMHAYESDSDDEW